MHPVCVWGGILQVVFVCFFHHCQWNWQQNWFERCFHWFCQHQFFNITSAACECGTEKNFKLCFPQMSNPLTYPWTALSWWFWVMRQLNGYSSLAWWSSAGKQCIEKSEWNDKEDLFNFLLACSTLFPTRKNFDWLHFQFPDHCNSHLMAG